MTDVDLRSEVISQRRLRIVLDGLVPNRVKHFGVALHGVELCAEDMHWSFGSGAPVRGNAQDLVLAVCGRSLPAGRLRGEGADRFTTTPTTKEDPWQPPSHR